MNAVSVRDQIAAELERIPEARLPEVFDLLRFYRLGLEASPGASRESVMSYAGAWQDMDAKQFEEFSQEIRARRGAAFGDRMTRDGYAD